MTYDELERLPADAYLEPERFRTRFDTDAARREQRYQEGLRAVVDYTDFTIGYRSVWSANTPTGGHVTSYEGIGYHAYTADFLRGLLESGVKLYVLREHDDGMKRYLLERDGILFGNYKFVEVDLPTF